MNKIPLFDLKRQHQLLKVQILKSWGKILDVSSFTNGEETKEFEQKYAKICDTKYALGVHSGTDSLIIALKAANLKSGDEVITTPCTFTATSDAIIHVGAKPVFADVQPNTGNIDPKEITKKITPKTKAILLVHLYGVPCDMNEIMYIAKKNRILVIEDASHGHGSLYNNKRVGSFGLAGCFSLYPSKTLGALGNAGIIISNNKKFIRMARMYADHGVESVETKYDHLVSGFNKLIDNIQSATLLHKLPNLELIIKRKLEIAERYNEAFQKNGKSGMIWPKNTVPSIYVYSYQTKNRKKDTELFEKLGISTGIYYPTPLHLQPSMDFLNYKKGDFPSAERFFNQTLSLPIFAELTNEEVEKIVNAISKIR